MALAFARQHLGNKPVSAIIFTHAHVDHFGGVLGVTTAKDAADRKLPIVAPEGFMEEATSENVMVGTGMARRSMYQFGKNLPRSAKGNVDTGLGKDVVYGLPAILPPTVLIDKPDQALELDGVKFVFHNVPNAECPAELSFSIPDKKLYDGAENLAQTMHNLLPIRGAKVRDSLRWSGYMEQALEHVKDADVYIASHNWPIWGNDRIKEFITKHRDVYKYTHDQTVRLINAGHTPREIAEMVKLPQSLASYFGARGYYGDLRHNVKAVYQFYLGAYDGNPANLNPLPPQESAKRYLELLGGADKAVAAAQIAFDKGDYRWAAELLNHAVSAMRPTRAAKELLAKAYEQMGYASEAATWRNSLPHWRDGIAQRAARQRYRQGHHHRTAQADPGQALAGSDGRWAGRAGRRRQGPEGQPGADGTQTSYVLWIENSVLHHRAGAPVADANATLTLTKDIFVKMIAGTAGIKDTLMSDDLKIDGSKIDLVRFFSLIEKAPGVFPHRHALSPAAPHLGGKPCPATSTFWGARARCLAGRLRGAARSHIDRGTGCSAAPPAAPASCHLACPTGAGAPRHPRLLRRRDRPGFRPLRPDRLFLGRHPQPDHLQHPDSDSGLVYWITQFKLPPGAQLELKGQSPQRATCPSTRTTRWGNRSTH